MKIPARPFDAATKYSEFINRMVHGPESDRAELARLFVKIGPTDEAGQYFHWDKFRFRPTLGDLDSPTAWALTRLARHRVEIQTPFSDTRGAVFTFTPIDQIQKALHEIDSEAH